MNVESFLPVVLVKIQPSSPTKRWPRTQPDRWLAGQLGAAALEATLSTVHLITWPAHRLSFDDDRETW